MTEPYSKKLLQRFKHPKFVKSLKNPNAVAEVGNVQCGDVMRLELEIDPKTNKIKDIGFKTFGCAAAIASSDAVCELAKGNLIEDAKKISKDDVIKKFGEMPKIKIHCSILGIEALRKAIKNYEEKDK